MESIKMNGLKIENMNGSNAVNASSTDVKIDDKPEDTLKDTTKSTGEASQDETKKQAIKHVLVYIGSSEFKDSMGHKWLHNDEQTYTEEEYAGRSDLHFMVKYGEMKHTIVTM